VCLFLVYLLGGSGIRRERPPESAGGWYSTEWLTVVTGWARPRCGAPGRLAVYSSAARTPRVADRLPRVVDNFKGWMFPFRASRQIPSVAAAAI
jgi:hypothetical protein